MFKAHLWSNSSRSNNSSNSSSTRADNNILYNPIVARNHKKYTIKAYKRIQQDHIWRSITFCKQEVVHCNEKPIKSY